MIALVIAVFMQSVFALVMLEENRRLRRREAKLHADYIRRGEELIAAHNSRTELANKLVDAYQRCAKVGA